MTEGTGGGRCYQVVAPIGQGGFGTVYRAELLGGAGFSKQVALKMLHGKHKRADEILRRLRDEARILGMVRHRAIVQVDGLVQLSGHWTIIMEYVSGANLKDCIKTAGPLPVAAALEIAAEIASALYEAYNTPGPDGRPLRILHRDIKPGNIQVPPSGALKILDFGIATADFERREANTTDRGFGSWDYVAPERLDGIDSPSGDVYSIGTLLFEALVGEAFGRASGNPVRHHKRLSEGLDRLASTPAGKVPEVVSLVGSLLAYDPEDRPASRDVERLALAARDAAGGEGLATWAARSIPMVVERVPRLPLDRLSGALLEEGHAAHEIDEEASYHDAAPAFGLPTDTDDLGQPGQRQDTEEQEQSRSERPALTLVDLATRDITPDPQTLAGRAWAVGSVVLLALVLMTMGAMVMAALTPAPPRPTVAVNRAHTRVPEPAKSLHEPEQSLIDEEESVDAEPAEGDVEEGDGTDEPTPRPRPSRPATVEVVQVTRKNSGQVTITGDHISATLIGDQGSFPPGRVPEGTYVIEASFPERGRVVAGRITVEAGRRLRVVCNASFNRCEPR